MAHDAAVKRLLCGSRQDDFLEKLIFQSVQENDTPSQTNADGSSVGHSVVPEPGFCLKTKNSAEQKVFINVCKHSSLPEAREISDAELVQLLQAEDPTGFRIPMSLGEPHAELDKSGKGCSVYDIIVNTKFYDRLHASELLMGFFITVVLEGIEAKYETTLRREWVRLKNRRFVGGLVEQHVRNRSKPMIMELESTLESSANQLKPKPVIESQTKSAEEPIYRLYRRPDTGTPTQLIAQIYLPQLKFSSSVVLELAEEMLVLQTRSGLYFLNISLPFRVARNSCSAQFNGCLKILTVTMDVLKE